MLWCRVLKKIDDVPHVSLDEISQSKKTYQNGGAGAQWSYRNFFYQWQQGWCTMGIQNFLYQWQ